MRIARAVIAPEAAGIESRECVDRSERFKTLFVAPLPVSLSRGVCACNMVYDLVKVQYERNVKKRPSTYADLCAVTSGFWKEKRESFSSLGKCSLKQWSGSSLLLWRYLQLSSVLHIVSKHDQTACPRACL